jgi:V/A-type H+-transporting ATPase subunit E
MMEMKLDSLIERIKKDGVQEAQKASTQIQQSAKEEADRVIVAAKLEAENIIENAKEEAARLRANTISALKQSARDLMLSVREQLVNLCDAILKEDISKKLTPDFLKELIVKVVDKWSPKKGEVVEVVVAEEDAKKLKQLISAQFKEKTKVTIEIKISRNIDKGFGIGIKGSDVYYDFTDESILEALKTFLNPAMSTMLNISNG